MVHTPATQLDVVACGSLVVHAAPHDPQFKRSLSVSTHAPAQVVPPSQTTTPRSGGSSAGTSAAVTLSIPVNPSACESGAITSCVSTDTASFGSDSLRSADAAVESGRASAGTSGLVGTGVQPTKQRIATETNGLTLATVEALGHREYCIRFFPLRRSATALEL
jgi:hypothetical protein